MGCCPSNMPNFFSQVRETYVPHLQIMNHVADLSNILAYYGNKTLLLYYAIIHLNDQYFLLFTAEDIKSLEFHKIES